MALGLAFPDLLFQGALRFVLLAAQIAQSLAQRLNLAGADHLEHDDRHDARENRQTTVEDRPGRKLIGDESFRRRHAATEFVGEEPAEVICFDLVVLKSKEDQRAQNEGASDQKNN